jgi:class 3 adenylate cyclase
MAAAENLPLVAEHQDLDLLGRSAAEPQRDQGEHSAKGEVHERRQRQHSSQFEDEPARRLPGRPGAKPQATAMTDFSYLTGVGYVFTSAGDGFSVAFASASGALHAALEAQRRVAAEEGPTPIPLTVRMGLHTREAGTYCRSSGL